MILRRLASAFRRQDWFTVFVETMIVVLGVFFGLQVNNWNAERADREREDVILKRLEADFTQIEAAARNGVAVTGTRIETIDELILQLRQEDVPDVDAIASTFFDALSYSRPIGLSPTYSEITSTGDFGLLQSESLRVSLSQYAQVRDMQAKVIEFIVLMISTDYDFQSVQASQPGVAAPAAGETD